MNRGINSQEKFDSKHATNCCRWDTRLGYVLRKNRNLVLVIIGEILESSETIRKPKIVFVYTSIFIIFVSSFVFTISISLLPENTI